MKKSLSLMLALCLLLTCMLAIPAANAEENCTLTLYYWDEGQKSGMDAQIELFENENPNIKIESTIIPWGQYWIQLQTSLPSGTGPDLFWMNLYAPEYIDSGLIYDLTDKIAADGIDMSKYPSAVTEMYTMNDHIYGIPRDFDSIALWYNKSIFDEMGVAYPEAGMTWDQFVEMCQKLTNDTHYGFVAATSGNEGTNNFIYQNGGLVVSEDHRTSTCNDAQNVGALQFMHDLMYKYKVSPNGAEQNEMAAKDMFISGQTATMAGGSWNVATFAEALGDNLGVTELPMNVSKGSTTHGLALCMSAKTMNADAAWKFLSFASTEKAQMATAQVVIPAYEGCAQTWVEAYPSLNLQVFVDALQYSKPNPTYIKSQSECGQIYLDAINTIWLNENADIQAIMDDAQVKIQALLDK